MSKDPPKAEPQEVFGKLNTDRIWKTRVSYTGLSGKENENKRNMSEVIQFVTFFWNVDPLNLVGGHL